MKYPDYSAVSLPATEHVVARILRLPTVESVDEEKVASISRTLVRGLNQWFTEIVAT